jgi:hypothetical protein
MERRKSESNKLWIVPDFRTCLVSYMDLEGVKHSVKITAGSVFEAAVVGMNAMKVAGLVQPIHTDD